MKKASVAKSAVMLFAVLCAAFAFGCVSPEDYEGGKLPALGAPQPAEADYTDALKNFDFDYSFAVPGGTLGYDHLIFGRNIKNDGEGREYYTFATQYMAPDDGYYLAYMRTSAMDECKENLQEIEDGWSGSPDYHFTSAEQPYVIDGKFFYSFRDLGKDFSQDIKFVTAQDLSQIKYIDGDFTLVFCAQSKDAVIQYNLTTGEVINRTVVLFIRYELEYDGDGAFTPYVFEGQEGTNQQYAKSLFEYVGTRIGAFDESYADADYLTIPAMGMQRRTIFAEVKQEGEDIFVELPRSTTSGTDLLNNSVSLLDDIYGSAKQFFKEAYVKEGKTASGYVFGLYDYNKVAQILKDVD